MAGKDRGGVGIEIGNQGRMDKVKRRQEENEPTHFYHVTTHRFRVGEMVTPTEEMHMVCLADKPLPHVTICERILPDPEMRKIKIESGYWREEWDGNWYTYEVEPVGAIEYGTDEDEILCKTAQVIRFVGDARAMLEKQIRYLKKMGKEMDGTFGTSRVRGVDNFRGQKVEGRGRGYWRHKVMSYERKKPI